MAARKLPLQLDTADDVAQVQLIGGGLVEVQDGDGDCSLRLAVVAAHADIHQRLPDVVVLAVRDGEAHLDALDGQLACEAAEVYDPSRSTGHEFSSCLLARNSRHVEVARRMRRDDVVN